MKQKLRFSSQIAQLTQTLGTKMEFSQLMVKLLHRLAGTIWHLPFTVACVVLLNENGEEI